MEIWIRELSDMLHWMLGSPKTPAVFVGFICLAVATVFVGMHWIGTAVRMQNLGSIRRLLAFIVGVPLLMITWIAAHRYLLPLTEAPLLRNLIIYGSPLAVAMLVVVPIQMLIFRAPYQSVLIAFLGSLLLAGLMIILANAVMTGISGGEGETRQIEKHNSDLNKIMGN